jgi:hypothetical protein
VAAGLAGDPAVAMTLFLRHPRQLLEKPGNALVVPAKY